MSSPFIHLHTHSHYSLLDGLSQIDRLVKQAKKNGMPALAITDHGNLYGAIEFYKKCKKEEIKPIIGVEAYIANRTRFDKDPGIDNKRYHLTLLAKNETGYHNLLKLVTASHLEGYYYKPRMDLDLLREHHEGLICLSGCIGGELGTALRAGDEEWAERTVRTYQEIFGAENYFLEIWHDPSIEKGLEVKNKIIEIGKKLNIPIVGTQDSHYLSEDDKEAHEALLAIQTNNDLTDSNRFSMAKGTYSFITSQEAQEKFADIPEAIENTRKIADMCSGELTLGKWAFPTPQIASGRSPDDELRALAITGIKQRGLTENPELAERLEYELGIIKQKGYASYFIVVADLLRYAHEHGIFTNIRGSVAGSLVTYLTGITKVNPIEYLLPFERFLNPERPSAPDIDMDFADDRRDEVIEYAKEKYGAEHVAQIGTFGKMLARGVVRDVARALGYPYAVGDKISRLIPMGSQGFPMTIDKAMKIEADLKKMYETDADAKRVIDLGKRLEGCARHISVHAAGVVIAPDALTNYTPLQFDPKGGKIITQYDMRSIDEENAGLLKFDFLGIRNLSILADAVDRVKKIRGLDIDIERIPMDDKKTFEMLARGETMGLFQLNGGGMTRSLVELKPTSIHDINLMVALYRPGPMENIDEYIARKHGKKPAAYAHPKMKNFLERTYGVLVYQDDLLLTAIEVAGYTWGEVDKFRKAVGKKIPEEMAKQHVKFVDGCQTHGGMSKRDAEALWQMFEPFQGYGFNKAHAASYGRVAYQTAYMKANYPAEYMTAVLTAESGDILKVSEIIAECKRMGFVVLPPDLNESFSDFTVVRAKDGEVTQNIRFGLRSIKNFGEEIGKAIIGERKERGHFTTLSDFLRRIQHKNLNKKSLEALIQSGAMDSLGERGALFAGVDDMLAFNRNFREGNSAQASLFSMIDAPPPEFVLKVAPPATLSQKLKWEKELLGLYVSGHPLEPFKDKLDKHDQSIESIKKMGAGSNVLVAGMLSNVKIIFTKSGNKMAFGKVTDFSGTIEVVAFSDTFEQIKEMFADDTPLAIRGSVSLRGEEPSVVIERAKVLSV